jgi:hypothetical protein
VGSKLAKVNELIRPYSDKFWNIFIILTVVTVGITTAVYLYSLDTHSLYFYSDSPPHAFLSRSYVDSSQPGFFEHLGTVWLPLPHLLQLPFTMIDPLFKSGFAGLLLSLPCHAITCMFLFKIIRMHVENSYIPIIGAFLYGFNPNFLYLSLVPMTEAPFMLFFVVSVYYLQKWLFDPAKNIYLRTRTDNILIYLNSNLVKSGIFVSLATLCRYEAWILSISLVIAVISHLVIKIYNSKYNLKSIKVTFTIFVFSVISFSGMILWLTWNAYSFGDALEFSNEAIFSAAAQARGSTAQALLYLQPLNVIYVYGTTLLYTFGPVVLTTALLGFLSSTIFSKDKDTSKRIIMYFVLVMPAVFTIISMIFGIGVMTLNRWHNSRFLILLGPLIVLLDCMFIAYLLEKTQKLKIKRRRIITVSIVAALFAFYIVSSLFIVVTFDNATKHFSGAKFAHSTGDYLGTIYDGNSTISLLTDAGDISKISIDSGVPLKNFIRISDSHLNSTLLYKPWLYAKYLVMSKEPTWDAKKAGDYWEDREDILSNFYDKVYDNKNFMIYVLTKNNKF